MEWLVQIHSVWRYVVLVTALAALVVVLLAAVGSRPWDRLSDRLAFFFPLAMDIQLLIGLGVWVLADWDRKDSFLFWIHPLLMLVAVGLAHAGRAMSERESDSRQKGTRASLFFGGSLVVVLVGIPLASWPI